MNPEAKAASSEGYDDDYKSAAYAYWATDGGRSTTRLLDWLASAFPAIRPPTDRTIRNWVKAGQWDAKATEEIAANFANLSRRAHARIAVLGDRSVEFYEALLAGEYDDCGAKPDTLLLLKEKAAGKMIDINGYGTAARRGDALNLKPTVDAAELKPGDLKALEELARRQREETE